MSSYSQPMAAFAGRVPSIDQADRQALAGSEADQLPAVRGIATAVVFATPIWALLGWGAYAIFL